jgi:hypothetical protein
LGARSAGSKKAKKTSLNVGNLPTTAIRHTIFAHKIFPIRPTMIQKSSSFSKMVSLSTTWFSQFAESVSEPTEKLGKTVLIIEISSNALLPEAITSRTELQIAQNLSCWKEDNASFP